MSNYTNQIKHMQQLNECLERTKSFLDLLKESQSATGENSSTKKINNLFSIEIKANICTGTESPRYTKNIYSDICFTNEIANTLIPLCQKRIKKIEDLLQKLFN